MASNRPVISASYDPVVRKTLCIQWIIGLLAAMVVDGGVMARVVGVAVLAFWFCVAVLVMHRPMTPTKWDLVFVRRGFWFVLAVAALRQMLG